MTIASASAKASFQQQYRISICVSGQEIPEPRHFSAVFPLSGATRPGMSSFFSCRFFRARTRDQSVCLSFYPFYPAAGAVEGGKLWKTGRYRHDRDFPAPLPACFCGEPPDSVPADCGNPLRTVFLVVSGGKTCVFGATNRSLWTDFFCFSVGNPCVSPLRYVECPGGTCGVPRGYSLPCFYAYPQTARQHDICRKLLETGAVCVGGEMHTGLNTGVFNTVFHRL